MPMIKMRPKPPVVRIVTLGRDDSLSIVKELTKDWGNVFIISHEENKGLCESTKSGIKAAKNDYIKLLDADDVLMPEIIEIGDSKYDNRNEIKEVYNSIDALNYIQKGFKFNIASIKRLYYTLTKNLTMPNGNKYPRGFKKVENIVNNQPTVPPDQVEWALEDLLGNYKGHKKETYPFKLAFDFHLRYENIHPFLDGNGRTGRLIMNKILMNHRYFPIIVYTKNSQAYFNAISRGLERQTKKNYYQFMLEQSKKTYNDFSAKIKNY